MIEKDVVEAVGHSVVQHGELNNRIYLMKLAPEDLPGILDRLDDLARDRGYTKIFAKVSEQHEEAFLSRAYRREGRIPGFYRGTAHGVFLGRYYAQERMTDARDAVVNKNLTLARSRASKAQVHAEDRGLQIGLADPGSAEEMAAVYREVFASYPFPIHDPEYIRETMASHVRYFYAKEHGRIIALSSAEFDVENLNVEMTDFATLPQCRGRSIAVRLLALMEDDPAVQQMKTAYTIARSLSPGMNITFARHGYAYGGTLVNNTNISGSIESMNIWYKALEGTAVGTGP